MKKSIALYDFDGTFTTSDSLWAFLRFYFSPFQLTLKLIRFSPYMIAMKMGFINNSKSKEHLCRICFYNEDAEKFNQKCQEFSKSLDIIVNPKAEQSIEEHIEKGNEVVVVSASFENYLMPYFEPKGIKVLATRLEIKSNKITGYFEGENCYGIEKVIRIKDEFKLDEFQSIYAYGDTKGDLPMLDLADHSFYKSFL